MENYISIKSFKSFFLTANLVAMFSLTKERMKGKFEYFDQILLTVTSNKNL